MKPVDQTVFADDPQGRVGNCLQAAVASLFEFDLDDVPNFANCAEPNLWWLALIGWAQLRGYRLIEGAEHPIRHEYLLVGASPRGKWSHVVVARDDEDSHRVVIHDPHPSRAGLATSGVPWVFAKGRSDAG